MTGTPPDRKSALPWIGWAASLFVILTLTLPWIGWFLNSPMVVYSRKVDSRVFFPPNGPEDRFQYFRHLVIAPGERVGYATCVLCSITVHGILQEQATTLWGDVTVAGDGRVGKNIEANGGRVTLLAGAGVGDYPLMATGGPVTVDPSVDTHRATVFGRPSHFYPGQRSWPIQGVSLFVLIMLSVSACGGWLVLGSLRERVGNAVRRPIRSVLIGIVLFALTGPLLYLAALSLYIFPPLGFLLYLTIPIVYWFMLTIGIAAVAERLGSLLVGANRLRARLTGAAFLIALMLIPVIGLFVMVAVIPVTLGVGTSLAVWRRVREPG